MDLVSVVATLPKMLCNWIQIILFFNNHIRPGVFESDPIYKLHVTEGLALVPAPSIDLRNRHIREQVWNGLHTLTFSNCDREPILDDEIEGGKDNRGRSSLSERRDFLSANIVRGGLRRHLPLEKKVVSLKTTLLPEGSIEGAKKWSLALELARHPRDLL